MSVTLLTAGDGEWNSKMAIFVLMTIGTLTLLIFFLLKFFMMQTDGALKQDCGDLTLTLEKRCHFRYEIENYFSCSHLARRDCDYHMIILVFRDKNEITYCYSHVLRRDWDFRKSFVMVVRKKILPTLTRIHGSDNSRWPLCRCRCWFYLVQLCTVFM